MLDWQANVIKELESVGQQSKFWSNRLLNLQGQYSEKSIHLAVFSEPYLSYVLSGQKTVETRFSSKRCAPYERVSCGDVILLKQVGGPVIGICEVRAVCFYVLRDDTWSEIKEFAREICAEEPSFWEERRDACFASLIHIVNVTSISPFRIHKRDRRGWVVIQRPTENLIN